MNKFLEDQAKERGMTVSEMMKQRSLKVRPDKRGLANNPDAAKKVAKLGATARWAKYYKENPDKKK